MESPEELKTLLSKGLALLKSGNNVDAIFSFEELLIKSERSAVSLSCLGLAMARARLDLRAAVLHCSEAIKKSPKKADFYLSLGEVYQTQGDKKSAIETLQKGLKVDRRHKGLRRKIKALGVRKKNAIPFLSRSNILNKFVGGLLREK
ncbi:MAG: tetratricopeptide repeat protein [Proteobacteria bacterium]|nr:tetratricopeptide repeat protein [Pseudomonadota bacterium]